VRGRLFIRLLLFITALFGVMAVVSALLASRGIRESLGREYEAKAVALARSIADGNTELLLGQDAGAIQAAIDLHQEMGGVAYIAVVDHDGVVVAHTFTPAVPREVAALLAQTPQGIDVGAGPEIRRLTLADGNEVIHVEQPVLGGRGGWVHLGMDTGPIRMAASHAIRGQNVIILCAFLACAALAFLYIRGITGPLNRLAAYARRVAAHDFSATCDVESRDEVGLLADTMRAMAGQVAGHVGQLERARAEATAELKDALESLSAIVGNIADALLVVDAGGVVLRHNPALVRMFGLPPEGIVGRLCAEALGAEVAAAALAPVEPGAPAQLTEVAALRFSGPEFPAEISVSRVRLSDGEASVCLLRDISAAKQLEREREASRALLERMVADRTRELSRTNIQLKIEVAERKVVGDALRRAEAKFRGIFENAVEGIYQVTPEGRYISANPAMAAIYGYASPEELVAKLSAVSPYVDPGRREAFLAAMEDKGQVHGFESQVRKKGGGVIWISENARRVTDAGGETLYFEGFVGDITLRKEAETRLLHQAFHDPLTGLPNRLLFLDHLRMAMDRARRRSDFLFAVVYMDLDRFKIINDSLGHDIGDRLLRHVSAALLSCARSTDTVARFGGDEFAILLEDLSAPRDAIRFCRRILDEVARPMDLAGREVQTSGSLGIVLHTDGYERPEALLRDADTAMYHAKAQGKSRFKVFNKRMHHQAQELMEMEIELRRAVAQEELCLVFQPIVDIRERRLAGFEALVRWPRTGGRMTSPAEFIPLAEETGIIYPLDHWVFAQACCTVKEFERALAGTDPADRSGFATNVNISARHFRNPLLAGHLEQVMRTCEVEPSLLALEITESVLLDNVHSAREVAAKLRELGLGLCIDDFGTGYSSLSYIQRFSVDAIKIDRAFVSGLSGNMTDPGSEAIVRTIVTLGAGLGLKVVAEGVETAEQLGVLQDMGCRYAQGYLFARALSAAEAVRLIESGAVHAWPGFPESGWR
jgi:diguanylate cyclase (GGDEF)-like protein/PAS domain S-box-containing protein